ncbi:hypothetical protein [Pontibacter harenae]|uniref:hypothetical protein n=1 Tax=Pontibacter harenae TaxID=2894083 RepID=UPI001E5869A6|nr:hypothetical protein [Pontibacter harenae]MCC9167657.1 hypothetical protein [Pontibacter harenae]
MTKGHNQQPSKQTDPKAKNSDDLKQNHSLSDQQKDKSPNQGRSSGEDPSGGTKGQNAI